MPEMPLPEPVAELLAEWATAYQQGALADDGAWLLETSIRQQHRPADARAYAATLLEGMAELVQLVLTYRFLHWEVDETQLAWTRRFLELQRYGARRQERGARWDVVLIGASDLPLYVDRIDDLDFDDLRMTDYTQILVAHDAGVLTREEAEAVARAIHEDLNYELDVHTYWKHSGEILLVGFDEQTTADETLSNAAPTGADAVTGELDEPAPMGRMRYAGALATPG